MVFNRQIVAVFCFELLFVAVDDGFVFGMDGDKCRNFLENLGNGFRVVYQHVACGRTEKQFDTAHFFVIHGKQGVKIVVGAANEETVVGVGHFCRTFVFVFQNLNGNGCRFGVRHIHKGSYAACNCSTRFCFDIAFVSQSRVAEMHLVVNHSRNQHFPFSVNNFRTFVFKFCGGNSFRNLFYEFTGYDNIAEILAIFVNYLGVVNKNAVHDLILCVCICW